MQHFPPLIEALSDTILLLLHQHFRKVFQEYPIAALVQYIDVIFLLHRIATSFDIGIPGRASKPIVLHTLEPYIRLTRKFN